MIIHRKKNNKNKNRKRGDWKRVLGKTLFWLALICFVGVAGWTVLFSSVMKVASVNVAGVQENEQLRIKAEVKELMDKKILDFVARDTLLLFPFKEAEKKLLSENRMLRSAKVRPVFPQGLNIELEQRKSHVVWCSNGKCFLVDERGEAFWNAERDESENIVTVTSRGGKEIFPGERIVDPKVVYFCEQLPAVLEVEAGVKIEKQLNTPSEMSEEVGATTTEGWKILLSTSEEIGFQAAVLKKIMDEKVGAEKRGELEYVDLRLKNKATYRFKKIQEERGSAEDGKKDPDERQDD